MMKQVFIVLLIVSLGLVSLSLLGCGGDNDKDSDYEIRPAPIHEVRVNVAESYPPQIFVYIKGGLSDGCTTFNEIETSRSDTTVTITVTVKHPKGDIACTAIYGYFEQTVALGSDFVSGQTYALEVNDYTTTFEYPI